MFVLLIKFYMIKIYDKIYKHLDEGEQCDTIYLDLAKAFDSLPHQLLIHKLRSYGINGNLLAWIKDYLTHRTQSVILEGVKSNKKPVLSGVPQGSILGPLLFIMYINDLTSTTQHDLYLYADDAKLMSVINDISDCHNLQHSLNN